MIIATRIVRYVACNSYRARANLHFVIYHTNQIILANFQRLPDKAEKIGRQRCPAYAARPRMTAWWLGAASPPDARLESKARIIYLRGHLAAAAVIQTIRATHLG